MPTVWESNLLANLMFELIFNKKNQILEKLKFYLKWPMVLFRTVVKPKYSELEIRFWKNLNFTKNGLWSYSGLSLNKNIWNWKVERIFKCVIDMDIDYHYSHTFINSIKVQTFKLRN